MVTKEIDVPINKFKEIKEILEKEMPTISFEEDYFTRYVKVTGPSKITDRIFELIYKK